MALDHTVKHDFVSLKGDGGDLTLIQPSNWNEDHDIVFTAGANVLLGVGAVAGPVTELTLGEGLEVSGGSIIVPFSMPVGMIVDFAGDTAPDKWLLCNGAGYSTGSQPLLYAVIGYHYGGSAGTFNVPDLRGRATFGRDAMGASAADRVTSAGSGIAGDTRGAAGGLENHLLVAAEIPPITPEMLTLEPAGAHIHFVVADGATATGGAIIEAGESVVRKSSASTLTDHYYELDAVSSPAPTLGETSEELDHTHAITFDEEAEAVAHNNMPPAMMMNKIIYAGE